MKCDTCKMKRVCDELERMEKVPKHEKCRCYSPAKPITEYDRIVRKSPEELAEWLVAILEYAESDRCGKSCPLYSYCIESNGGMLDWLKQEAKDGD